MIKFAVLKKSSAAACLIVLAILTSCNDDSADGPRPVPDNPCAPNVIFGYTDKVSYSPNEKVTAYLQSDTRILFCKLTIYTVNGEEAFSVGSPLSVKQISADLPYLNGYGFAPNVSFDIPDGLRSGMYLIENTIPFIVRPDGPVDVLVIYPSNTANAYCDSGGKSLYTPTSEGRPSAVSFLRPIPLQDFSEYCLRWFDNLEDVTVGYVADSDLDYYERISDAKILAVVGHNEYWTRRGRTNFDAFVDNGGHALVLSGNTMWWQVRYGSGQNQLICYRDAALDPEPDALLKTITWDKPSLSYTILSSIGADFNYGGYGRRFTDGGWNGFKIASPNSPLFKGLTVQRGDIISCPTVECDGAPLSGFDPDGYPIPDNELLDLKRIELVAFDKTMRVVPTYMTFIVFQRTEESGFIINTGSSDWCSISGMGGPDGTRIKMITRNAIQLLLDGENVFSN